MPPLRLALALWVLPLLATRLAAEVLPGELAPDIDAATSPGAQAPTAASFRGAFTLLEFFRTGCPHCQRDVPLVNALAARHAASGLRVLAVGYEAKADVDRFVRQYGVKVPVAYATIAAVRDYAAPTLPRCYLVDPAGRVTWAGAPTALREAELATILKSAPRIPEMPPALAWTARLLDTEAYGELDARLGQALTKGDLPPADARAAEGLCRWVRWYAEASLAAAEADALEGRSYEAWRTFRHLAAAYPGSPTGDAATKQVAALMADDASRVEVEAGRLLDAARERAKALRPADAMPLFREVVQRYRATRAADRARVFVADLEAEVRKRAGGR